MNMQVFKVGGAVRDFLLGREPKDIDYVVVGATPEEMKAAGFVQVGLDFPVFLHPETGAEYALARKERKVAAGYHGFETDHDISVTLEEDLSRRDLTINSIAMAEDGTIIDPFNGCADLEAKVLRHTTEAFAEDPLRVLRVARFAARYQDFSIADETMELMKQIVTAGEMEHLSKERIVLEFEKAFSESDPLRFIVVLHFVGALQVIIPELDERMAEITSTRFISWIEKVRDLTTVRERLAFLFRQIEADKAVMALDRLRFPIEIKEIIEDFTMFEYFYELNAEHTVKVFDHLKVSHSRDRFWRTFKMYDVVNPHRFELDRAWKLLKAYCTVNFDSLPNKELLKGKAIAEAIKAERIAKIDNLF